jgi:vancomycin resistance protein YoaR
MKKRAIFLFFVFLALLVITGLEIAIANIYYRDKVFPNVFVINRDIGNKTVKQVQESLLFLKQVDPEIILKDEKTNESYKFKLSNIGFYYNVDAVTTEAVGFGKEGNIFSTSKELLIQLFREQTLGLKNSYNSDLLDDQIEKIKERFNKPSHNAYFYLKGSNVEIEKEQKGSRVNSEKLKSQIAKSFYSFDFSPKVVPMEEFNPQILSADIEPLKSQAKNMVFSNPVLTYQKNKYNLKPEDIIKSIHSKNTGSVKLDLDQKIFSKILSLLTEKINTAPKGIVETTENEQAIQFTPTTPGITADIPKLASILTSALLSDDPSKIIVEIPTKEIPIIENKDYYGIKELLGKGESKFSGSISSRIHNIGLASSIIDGMLIAPGEPFSFNEAVGPIDSDHGFSSAYIISKGRTVLGEGGGICQVSTTLFRAVLNAGLEIISRTPHAYRVGYYEQDSPPGLDATIFQPTVDFKFKNDTKSYVLIDTEVDEKNLAMSFKIYGTSDGRTVTMTTPEIFSQTPPPEPSYEETDTLALGEKRQVDWSAWGATVKFSRIVSREDKTLWEDSFVSNYRPWRAVYLVGTRE